MDNVMVCICANGKTVKAPSGTVLSDALHLHTPCGGHGKCGKCKVIVRGNVSPLTDAEKQHLSLEELQSGVRLACHTRVLGDCEAETLDSPSQAVQVLTEGALPPISLQPLFSHYGVAVDIGTTTLAARLYDTDGTLLAEATALNPQVEWGADVVSRIEVALDYKAGELAASIRNAINELLSELARLADIHVQQIDGLVITGNTVMLYLLTEESVEPLSHAPFDALRLFGETCTAASLSLTCLLPNTTVYLPLCISAFVGADITCALLATQLCDGESAMLADIGTNGEMALWYDGRLSVCSTAAGPAFEGVGISMGMRGADGAIDRVWLRDGELCIHSIGDVAPKGICGSGLVDAVACMLETDVIDESGYLEEECFLLQEPVALIPKDLRMLQLAKSAICAGMLTLLESEELKPSDISQVFIAGGFGHYLNVDNAAKIGLLPRRLSEKVATVGNAALAGASMLLLDKGQQEIAAEMTACAQVLELSSNPVFSEHYMMGMLFDEV